MMMKLAATHQPTKVVDKLDLLQGRLSKGRSCFIPIYGAYSVAVLHV